eukprot:430415_1
MDQKEPTLKQGYLDKKSRHIGAWRKRWIVVTSTKIFSYKSRAMNQDPTEIITVKNIKKVRSISDTIMSIESDVTHKFKANTETQKTEWIDFINRLKFERIAMPVIVQCADSKYDDNFYLSIPYDKNYTYCINTLISDTLRHINNKHNYTSFVILNVSNASFIGLDIKYNRWKQLSENITTFLQTDIEKTGIFITIEETDIWTRKCIDIPVFVNCQRNEQFNDKFFLPVPYHVNYPYSIQWIINDIMNYVQEKHSPFTLIPVKITPESFMGMEIYYDDYDWNESDKHITDYVK